MSPGRRSKVAAPALKAFRSYLAENGMRFTAQRRLILEQVFRQRRHLDADELYDVLRDAGASVSRATVYRTLGHLRECGLVREILQGRGRASYEPVVGRAHHDHMVCLRCGTVIEFFDGEIEALQERVCRKRGFEPVEHRMRISGICRECRATQKGESD